MEREENRREEGKVSREKKADGYEREEIRERRGEKEREGE